MTNFILWLEQIVNVISSANFLSDVEKKELFKIITSKLKEELSK